MVNAPPGPLSVLVVDDHLLFRQSLKRILLNIPEIRIAGEAENGLEALHLFRQLHPDIVIMDISMPVMDGLEATRCIKAESQSTCIIGLSMHDDECTAEAMRKAGAQALLSKTNSTDRLIEFIQACAQSS